MPNKITEGSGANTAKRVASTQPLKKPIQKADKLSSQKQGFKFAGKKSGKSQPDKWAAQAKENWVEGKVSGGVGID